MPMATEAAYAPNAHELLVYEALDGVHTYTEGLTERYGTSADLRHDLDDFASNIAQTNDVVITGYDVRPEGDKGEPLVAYVADLYPAKSDEARDLSESQGATLYYKGGVHENELAYRKTMRSLLYLATTQPELLRKLGIGRIIIFDANPEGSDKNTWQTQEAPLTLYSFLSQGYRGIPQIDWSYPLHYDDGEGLRISNEPKLRGTIASQHIIDTFIPDVLQSGHNAVVSGWYCYVTNGDGLPEQIYQLMVSLGEGRSCSSAPPDLPGAHKLSEGVYSLPPAEEIIAHFKAEHFGDPEAAARAFARFFPGDLSIGYARRVRPAMIGVLMEPTYFEVAAMADTTPSGQYDHDVQRDYCTYITKHTSMVHQFLATIDPAKLEGLDRELFETANFLAAYFDEVHAKPPGKLPPGDPGKELSHAELAGQAVLRLYYPCVSLGAALRLARSLGDEYTKNANVLDASLREVTDRLELLLQPRPSSPSLLVKTHLGALLLAVGHVSHSKTPRQANR